MDAKEFELPIEGSLGKLALLHSGQPKETKTSFSSDKAVKKTKPEKKNNPSIAKRKK